MTQSGSTSPDGVAQTPEEIEADIEQQREQLAQTVDQLTAKLDVRSRAQDKVHAWRNSATTDTGQPRPEVLAAAALVAALVVVLVVRRRRR